MAAFDGAGTSRALVRARRCGRGGRSRRHRVTGTEVLNGRITDRNGPWISEASPSWESRCRTSSASATATTTSRRRFASSPPGRRPGRHERRPGADRRRPDRRGGRRASPGRELVLDEEMEERIAEILPASPSGCASTPRRFGGEPKAGDGAPRARPRSTRPGPRPGWSSRPTGPTVIVLPGPPRELQAMWPTALETGARPRGARPGEPYSSYTLRMFGIPESEIAKTLREIEARHRPLGARDHHLPARRRARRSTSATAPAARRRARRCVEAVASATAASCSAEDGSTIDEQVAELLRGPPDRAWPSRAPAGCSRRG